MAIFKEELTPEEEEAGFSTDELDNDIFTGRIIEADKDNSLDLSKKTEEVTETVADLEEKVGEIVESSPTDSIVLEESLLDILRADIDKSAQKTQTPAAIEEFSTDNDLAEDTSFSDIAKSNDLADTSNEMEIIAANTISNNFDDVSEEKENTTPGVNILNSSEEIEKKRKPLNPIKIIALLTAAAIVLVIGGIFSYYYLKYSNKTQEEENNYAVAAKDNEIIKDTAINTPQKEEILEKKDTTEKEQLKIITEIPNSISAEEKTTISENKPIFTQKKSLNTYKKQPPAKNVASNSVNSKNYNKINTYNKSSDEIYSVQIYASLNREDADLRLKLLKEKGISGTISTQKIKGKIWYRVRFGNYNSYEVAQNSALEAGFSQPWIERIK